MAYAIPLQKPIPDRSGDCFRYHLYAGEYLIAESGPSLYITRIKDYINNCANNSCWRHQKLLSKSTILRNQIEYSDITKSDILMQSKDVTQYPQIYEPIKIQQGQTIEFNYLLNFDGVEFKEEPLFRSNYRVKTDRPRYIINDHFLDRVQLGAIRIELYFTEPSLTFIIENKPDEEPITKLVNMELVMGSNTIRRNYLASVDRFRLSNTMINWSKVKINYIPQTGNIVVSLNGNNGIPPTFIYNLNERSYRTYQIISVSDKYMLTTEGKIYDLSNPEFNEDIYISYPVVQQNIPGKWWIPLGFTTGNRSYWLEFTYTRYYIQPTKIMRLPDEQSWNLPSKIGKTYIPLPPDIQDAVEEMFTHKLDDPREVYNTVFNTTFGSSFWNWSVDPQLERVLLWSSRTIVYFHPQMETVFITPPLKRNERFMQPTADDNGFIMTDLFNSHQLCVKKFYFAQMYNLNHYSIYDEKVKRQTKLTLARLNPNMNQNQLPPELTEKIFQAMFNDF